MPRSLHKVLIHGGLLVNDSIIPIGQMSEEVKETRNKDSRYFCEHHTRKFNRKQSIEDMIQMLLVSSDPYITILRKIKRKKKEFLPKEILGMLKTPQVSFSQHESSEPSASDSE
ncbi:uncharacterized protein TNCT_540451 [Trichonephila clavata]|uniref:Uncharacterized protein n=1 Tax=Trichonephila clavata TaxID=2740835 RepID=A0A8X6L380_TRICU|nr:uncharacterized protein TNCT_540451 [Trichonephila clavata]